MRKLFILAAALMLLLVLFACSDNPAPLIAPPPESEVEVIFDTEDDYNYDDTIYEPDTYHYGEYDYDVEDDYDFEDHDTWWSDMPVFGSWTGQVTEIHGDDDYPPMYTFIMEGEDGNAMFVTDFNTFILGNAPEIGDNITGFYLLDMPMAMIYPPRYVVSVIVNGEFNNIAVDRFDEELISYDGSLRLNINDETEIILQDGELFDCELAHRKLVVVYDISTRSIPAQTAPSQIIVLFEHPVTGPAFL